MVSAVAAAVAAVTANPNRNRQMEAGVRVGSRMEVWVGHLVSRPQK